MKLLRRINWNDVHAVDAEHIKYIMSERSTMARKEPEKKRKKKPKEPEQKPYWFHAV